VGHAGKWEDETIESAFTKWEQVLSNSTPAQRENENGLQQSTQQTGQGMQWVGTRQGKRKRPRGKG